MEGIIGLGVIIFIIVATLVAIFGDHSGTNSNTSDDFSVDHLGIPGSTFNNQNNIIDDVHSAPRWPPDNLEILKAAHYEKMDRIEQEGKLSWSN